MEQFDIVIIGGGPGGYTAAIRAAIKGAKVAVVESRELGGVCLNRGCIPSKALIASASEYHRMKNAEAFGIKLASSPVYDWSLMIARKDKIVDGLVRGIGQLFKSHGVSHISGFGRIADKNRVIVTDENHSETELKAKNIIVATGSRAASIPTVPIDGHRVVTSDHLLVAENLPQSILIIGAGVIGCEWACMLSLLEVKVYLVEMLDRPLLLEDEGTSKLMAREMKKLKIDQHFGVRVESMTPGPEGLTATLSDGKIINANQSLVAVGRLFNTEDIGLEEVGVKLNQNGSIKTSPDMRTTVDNIYAIGDVRGEILLAYTATHDGSVAVDNCLGEKRERDYTGLPSVIFTHPEVASVGLTEQQAAEKYEIAIGKFPLRALGKAHAENEIQGEVKLIGDKKTDKLLGAHVVGVHATEVIHTAALAINRGLTVTELGDLIFGHPVISESLMEAAHDLHGMSVHLAKKQT